jgi:hypothetical protein
LNPSMRWFWLEHDFRWMWPETVLVDEAVPVVDGVIDPDDLVDSGTPTACSLWSSDPRVENSTACKVYAVVDADGVHLTSHPNLTTVFAFYRKAVPQATWAAASLYATPVYPAVFREAVVARAHSKRLRAKGEHDEANVRRDEARDWLERRRMGLTISGSLPWIDHVLVL